MLESPTHRYLHRKEDHQDNAAYWYGRAGKPVCREPLDVEFISIVRDLLGVEQTVERSLFKAKMNSDYNDFVARVALLTAGEKCGRGKLAFIE